MEGYLEFGFVKSGLSARLGIDLDDCLCHRVSLLVEEVV
jgi:hypothetical protein